MTGIRNRIDDAKLLWESGRLDGAFLNALIAVAATARERYPKLKDGEKVLQSMSSRSDMVGFTTCCEPLLRHRRTSDFSGNRSNKITGSGLEKGRIYHPQPLLKQEGS